MGLAEIWRMAIKYQTGSIDFGNLILPEYIICNMMLFDDRHQVNEYFEENIRDCI